MKSILIIQFCVIVFLLYYKVVNIPKEVKPEVVTVIEKEYIYLEKPKKEETPVKVEENTKSKILFNSLAKTYMIPSTFAELPFWEKENYDEALANFTNSCSTKKTKKLYKQLCKKALVTKNAKKFIEKEFLPYKITTSKGKEKGLLTGYYEPELYGSRTKTKKYKYPIHETPDDLVVVDLGSIYPKLKHYRLRGKIEGNKLIPYDTRKQSASKDVPAKVICYVDSKIDLFFLEIQGSGRVKLDDGSVMYIGYDNQNGHRYRAIGRYLVKIGALKLKNVSLQSIRAWLDKNPRRVDEVLHYNKSVVYFKERQKSATGALGICLTSSRSIAVDRRYIPLGSMLYLNAKIAKEQVSKIVLAQDTGGAIKGVVRADMFLGCGTNARETAGELKSPLELWILLPQTKKVNK